MPALFNTAKYYVFACFVLVGFKAYATAMDTSHKE